MLDTIRTVETPEGVGLRLRLSGPVVRSLAWSIDTLIRAGLYIALAVLLSWLDDLGTGVFLILAFIIEWFYPVIFEVRRDGMTPGKRALGIRTIHDDGTPIGWSASVVRNLLRFVDSLPLFYVVGLTSMTLSPEFRRLGDIVAGTLVVYADDPPVLEELPEANAVAPAWPLQADEAQAVVAFAERHAQLGAARADELARATGPLLPPDAAAAPALLAIARWVWGR